MIPQLLANASFFRSRLDLETVESTNDVARDFLDQPELLPMLIVARAQTKGRGRGENRWWSDQGSILATLVINPQDHGIPSQAYPLVGLALALGVLDALFFAKPSVELRWPNDIEAGGKKLGGILPEVVESVCGPRIILGLGLNITSDLSKAPPEVARMATTFQAVWGHPTFPLPTKEELLSEIAFDFNQALFWLRDGSDEFENRLNRFDSLRGKRIEIAMESESLVGIGAGITATGGLKVATPGGIRVIHGGRVLRQ